jgi:hypothetical protein
MRVQHQNLAAGRWTELSLVEQMANIGSEVERAIKWRAKANQDYAEMAFERSLELIDFSLNDLKNRYRLKEIARLREIWTDFFKYDNMYHSTSEQFQKYFYAFNYAARISK